MVILNQMRALPGRTAGPPEGGSSAAFSTVSFSALTLCLFSFFNCSVLKFGHIYYGSYLCCSSHLFIYLLILRVILLSFIQFIIYTSPRSRNYYSFYSMNT